MEIIQSKEECNSNRKTGTEHKLIWIMFLDHLGAHILQIYNTAPNSWAIDALRQIFPSQTVAVP